MEIGAPRYTQEDYDRILHERWTIIEREKDAAERTRQLSRLPSMDYVSRHMDHLLPDAPEREPELLVEHGPDPYRVYASDPDRAFEARLEAAQGIENPWDQARAIGPGPVATYGGRARVSGPVLRIDKPKLHNAYAVRLGAAYVLVMMLLNAFTWQVGLDTPIDTNQMEAITLATLVVVLMRG